MLRTALKKGFVVLLIGIVALNFILFVKKHVFTGGCELNALLKDRGETLSGDVVREPDDSPGCVTGVPCQYTDSVDFRIIVMTFNRWRSLTKLLNSLNDLHTDGDRVALEIWIDRKSGENGVDEETVSTARSFQWTKGEVRVHVRNEHAGIIGQWIDTWRPASNDTEEIALILEDDLSVSPYAYRWVKAARNFYRGRKDVAGITLQSEGLIVATSGSPLTPTHSDGVAYLYSLLGSWGYAPNPEHWLGFQNWYHRVSKDPHFQPYVEGLLMTRWFKTFQKQKRADSMWTMWFIYYCHENNLFTIYNNLNAYNKTKKNCLCVNRREAGLHFKGKGVDNTNLLLREWKDEFVNFRETVAMYGFNGKSIPSANTTVDNNLVVTHEKTKAPRLT